MANSETDSIVFTVNADKTSEWNLQCIRPIYTDLTIRFETILVVLHSTDGQWKHTKKARLFMANKWYVVP